MSSRDSFSQATRRAVLSAVSAFKEFHRPRLTLVRGPAAPFQRSVFTQRLRASMFALIGVTALSAAASMLLFTVPDRGGVAAGAFFLASAGLLGFAAAAVTWGYFSALHREKTIWAGDRDADARWLSWSRRDHAHEGPQDGYVTYAVHVTQDDTHVQLELLSFTPAPEDYQTGRQDLQFTVVTTVTFPGATSVETVAVARWDLDMDARARELAAARAFEPQRQQLVREELQREETLHHRREAAGTVHALRR